LSENKQVNIPDLSQTVSRSKGSEVTSTTPTKTFEKNVSPTFFDGDPKLFFSKIINFWQPQNVLILKKNILQWAKCIENV